MVQWLRLHAPNAGGSGWIPSPRTRPYILQLRALMLQLKIPHAATKTQSNQINIFLKSKRKHQNIKLSLHFKASLMAQWWRIWLPMQGTPVWSLVQEDPTFCRAARPVSLRWACTLEPGNWNYWSPRTLDPMLCSKRRHCNEKSLLHNQRAVPLTATREKAAWQGKPSTAKINKK